MERNERNWSTNDGGSFEGHVEKLPPPLEVIGDIMSRVKIARDVIRASLTCRAWREAYRKHLHTLSFDVADDKRVYRKLYTSRLELLITMTIIQTPGLQRLLIRMDTKTHRFSAAAVVGWLAFTRDTLLELFYEVDTFPGIYVLDICGWPKLKTLSLCKCPIREGEPKFQRFPCLTSLSLNRVRISVKDLNRLVLAFPKLECLQLVAPILRASHEVCLQEITVKLCCPKLKTLLIEDLTEFEFILEKCDVGYLHVKDCYFCSFKVYGSKSLRHFKISDSEFRLLEIEEGDNLETLEVIKSHVTRSNLLPMNVQTPKLETFRFWGFYSKRSMRFQREDEKFLDRSFVVVDFERMALCSPQLSHLIISYDDTFRGIEYSFEGSSFLVNLALLEVGCDEYDGFWEWADEVLRCCPNVRKLIVHIIIPEDEEPQYCKDSASTSSAIETMRMHPGEDIGAQISSAVEMIKKHPCKDFLAPQTSSVVELMRKCQHLQVELACIYQFASSCARNFFYSDVTTS